MADYKRQNTRYNAGYRTTPTRDFVPDSNCNCNNRNPIDTMPSHWLKQYPIGMAYVPMQQFENLYEMEVGLQRGTIFAQLDLPFEVGFCARGCNCQ